MAALSLSGVLFLSRTRLHLAAVLWIVGAACAQSPPQSLAGRPVTKVRIEPGTPVLATQDLQDALTVKEGQALDLTQVSSSIERLFATGRFGDIRAEAEADGNGVAVIFVATPAYFIGQVTVIGVPDPPNPGQLVNSTKLALGTLYTPGVVRQAEENLSSLLRANGMYEHTLRSEVERHPGTQQIDVRFVVEPGVRAKFAPPIIKGTPGRTDEQIIKATRWRKYFGFRGWKPITETRVQQGQDRVRQSYQKQDRLLARVVLEGLDYEPETKRATPTLNIESGPKVRVRVQGAKVSGAKLRQLIPIYQEQAVDNGLLIEGQRNLTTYWQGNGYFNAETQHRVETVSPDEQLIEYTVRRGPRYKLQMLDVNGNEYFDDQTISERMSVQPATLLRFRNGRFSQALLDQDIDAIESLYRSNGFRDINVTSSVEQNYRNKPQDLAVRVTIQEGPQSYVESIDVQGVEKEDADTIRSLVTSLPGQPYSDLNVQQDRDAIVNYYYNNGYPDATVDVTTQPANNRPSAFSVLYAVQEGQRAFIRDILISGLSTTKRDLVDEKIVVQPGQPLSQSLLIEGQRRLYDLGIFARVDTAIQNPTGTEEHKNVIYNVEEARRYSLNFGVGAQFARIGGGSRTSLLTAPAGRAGFAPRVSFGISRLNFLGIGHTVGLQTRLSNIERRALLTYLAPQFIGNDRLSLTISGIYDDSRNINTFNVRRQEGTFQVQQRLTRSNSAQYRYTYRQVRTSDIKITQALVPALLQDARVGLVSAAFIRDRRDDPVESRRGNYNSVDSAFAGKYLGSQANFGRVLFRNSTYHRIGRETFIARSLNFGTLTNVGTLDVPLAERFFSGGASSHRGFPENQAGPRDAATGFPIGGKALLMHGTELRFPLLGDNIGGVFFHDMGNVYTDLSSISLRWSQREIPLTPELEALNVPTAFDYNYTAHAAGFGIRYRTPIGPVRVDLSYALNPPRFFGCQGSIETLLTECDPSNPAYAPNFRVQRVSRFQFFFSLGQTF